MPEANMTTLEAAILRQAEAALNRVAAARSAIGSVIFGQAQVVEETLVTLLSGGHGLLVGVPGLAKTKLVETLGLVLGLNARRVQFTPDLMPADILGSEVLEETSPFFPLCAWADFRAASDGRRDQPREPAHAIGPVAGNAGAACLRGGRAL
jgi:hypothetical protein